MRISVLQENLFKGLGIVKNAVKARPYLPVLANVLLTDEDGRLKLTATDLEMSISVWMSARVEQSGAITIPAKMFYDLTNNLSPERVDLELDTRTQTLHLDCGGSKVQLKGITADEFPPIRTIENGKQITLPGEMLRNMINEVTISAATVDNRPVLTGIYTNFEGSLVTMASADGYRLTVRKDVLDVEVLEPITAIIPARVLILVAKLVGNGKKAVSQVQISLNSHMIVFDLGDIEITCNLLEGTFPAYERIVPQTSETATIVYRDEFLRACKKAQLFAKDSANTVHLDIHPSGTMNVNARSSEMGEVSSMIDASVTGHAIKAAFNVAYLIDTAKVIQEDQIVLETITSGDPMVIRSVGRTDLYYVIMSMQVGQ